MENPIPSCTICQELGSKSRTYLRCTRTNVPGDRDPECSCCHEPFEPEEKLLMHNDCQHVYHEFCIERWACSKTISPDSTVSVDCPMCRGPLLWFTTGYMMNDIFTIATDTTLTRIQQLYQQGIQISFQDRAVIPAILDDGRRNRQTKAASALRFFERNILFVQEGKPAYRRYQIPPQRKPGAEIFYGETFVHGGVLSANHCLHIREVILLTGKQIYALLPDLYLQGWGSRQFPPMPPLKVTADRSLAQLVSEALGDNVREVWFDHVQLAAHFPHFEPFRLSWELFIKVFRSRNGDNVQSIRAHLFSTHSTVTSDQFDQENDQTRYQRSLWFANSLGGLGSGIRSEALPQNDIQLFDNVRAYYKLLRSASLTNKFWYSIVVRNGVPSVE